MDEPAWVASFDGPGFSDVAAENGAFIIPADPSIAAGPDHVVAVVNTSIAAWSKSGSPILRQPFSAFFAPLAPAGTLFDPKVRYSRFDGRFVVVLLELQDSGQGAPGSISNLLVAVSQTSDPSAGWILSRIDMRTEISGASHWADFPGLAVDDDLVYVTANLFAFGTGTYGGTRLWVLDMDDLVAGTPGSPTVLDPFSLASVPSLSSTVQPAIVHGKLPGDPTATWLVEYSGLNDEVSAYVGLYRLTDPLGSASVEVSFLELGAVDDFAAVVPGAPQSGSMSLVATNDRRALDAVWRADRLVGSFTLVPPGGPDAGQATAAWFEAEVSTPGAPSLVVFGIEGAEELAPGTHTYFPAIDLGADGSLSLGYSASSGGAFVGAYASLRAASDPVGSLRSPLALHTGSAPYVRTFGAGSNRWGDYSGVSADPAGDGSFWVFNKYAESQGDVLLGEDGRWGTRVGRLALVTAASDPVAADDFFETLEDTALLVAAPGVLANDTDEESALLSAELLAPFGSGSLTLHPNGGFEYLPAPDFSGADTFTYSVIDDSGRSDTGTVTISVVGVNDPPVAISDAYETAEDVALEIQPPGLLENDTDIDSPLLSVLPVIGPAHGQLVLAENGGFRFEPAPDFSGVDGFSYAVSDGAGGTDIADVVLTVTAVNDPPEATDDSYAISEDRPLLVPAPGVLVNDRDVDSNALVATIRSAPLHGVLSLLPDGSFAYVPAADFAGADGFVYDVRDDVGALDTGHVTIQVEPVNDPPTAVQDSYSTTEEVSIVVAAPGVLLNDVDVDSSVLTAEVALGTRNGVLAFAPDGSFIYAPAVDFTGEDRFTYRVRDDLGAVAIGTVILEVLGTNDPPVALADSWSTTEDTPLVVSAPGVLGNDVDPDSPTLSVDVRDGPRHGLLSLAPDGGFRYDPEPDWWGADGFTYAAADGSGGVAMASVALDVTPVNDPPRATPSAVEVQADGAVSTRLVATDADGDPLAFSISDPPTRGRVALAGDRATYTPEPGFAGSDAFRFAVSDPGGLSDAAEVTITVRGTATAQAVYLPPGVGPVIDIRFGQEYLARDLRPGEARGFSAARAGVAQFLVSDATTGAVLWDGEITLDNRTIQQAVVLRAPDGSFAVYQLAGAQADHLLPGVLLRTAHLLPGRRLSIVRESDTPDHTIVEELARDLIPDSPTPYSVLADAAHNLRVMVERDQGVGGRREETYRFDFSGYDGRSIVLLIHPEPEPAGFDLRAVTSTGDVLPPIIVTGEEEVAPRAFSVSAAFPNPAVDVVHFSIDGLRPGRVAVEIHDLLGRWILRVEPTLNGSGREELLIDARSLPSGVYVARVTQKAEGGGRDGFGTVVRQFVIAR